MSRLGPSHLGSSASVFQAPLYHFILTLWRCINLIIIIINAWFPPFRCRAAVAVRAVAVTKLRKNSVSAVRITLHT